MKNWAGNAPYLFLNKYLDPSRNAIHETGSYTSIYVT